MSTPVTPTTPTSTMSASSPHNQQHSGPRLSLARRRTLRSLNKSPASDVETIGGLDLSLKRNMAFVKKLKSVSGGDHFAGLLAEFEGLKLSKFLDEAILALLENRPRTSGDWAAYVEILCAFNRRYPDFARRFLISLESEINSIPDPGPSSTVTEEKAIWLQRQRQLLRLQAELCLVGIYEWERGMKNLLANLRRLLPIEDEVNGSIHLTLASGFVRSLGPYFLSSQADDESLGEGKNQGDNKDQELVSVNWKNQVSDIIMEYFRAQCRYLVRCHQKLMNLKRRSRHHYEHRGDLSAQQTEQLQQTIQMEERLKNNLQSLADALQLSLPILEDPQENGGRVGELEMVEGKIVFADPTIAARLPELKSLVYDSEEEQLFYEDLINLAEMVPTALLTRPSSAAPTGSEPTSSVATMGLFTRQDEEGELELLDVEPIDPDEQFSSTTVKEEDRSRDTQQVVSFFEERLPNIRSRHLVDQAAVAYCFIHNRSLQRRLISALLELPYRRLDLLPFLARFLATLRPAFPDVSQGVVSSLIGQFTFLLYRSSVSLVGTRTRIGRYLGELIRFGIVSQGTAYALLRRLVIDNLVGANIDMTAILLESAGRFLLNQPESYRRLSNLFEIIRKKQRQGKMTMAQMAALDNALYLCDPGTAPPLVTREPRTPLELYLRHLLRGRTEQHRQVEQLLKFPWDQENWRRQILTVLRCPWKISGEEESLNRLAQVIAALSYHKPAMKVELVDGLLEDLRYYLMVNLIKFNQRLLAIIQLLGELGATKVIEEETIWWILNFLLTFGQPSGNLPTLKGPTSPIDPPTGFMRIRLLCSLLNIIAERGYLAMRDHRWNQFWRIFEYYVATKVNVPLEVQHQIEDVANRLGKKYEKVSSEEAIDNLVKDFGDRWEFLRQLPPSNTNNKNGNFATDDEMEEEILVEEDESLERNVPILNSRPTTKQHDELDQAIRGMVAAGLEERRLEKRVGVFDSPIPLSIASPAARKLSTAVDDKTNQHLRLLVKKRNKITLKELNPRPADGAS